MNERLESEEEYREVLRRFIDILENNDGHTEEIELLRLIRLLELYEYENC